jgi:hypothetical protein
LIVGGPAGLRAGAAVVGAMAAFAAGADVDSAATPPEVAGELTVGVAGFVAAALVVPEPVAPVLPVRPMARPGALLPTPWPDPSADSDEKAFAADCDSARPSSSWTVGWEPPEVWCPPVSVIAATEATTATKTDAPANTGIRRMSGLGLAAIGGAAR